MPASVPQYAHESAELVHSRSVPEFDKFSSDLIVSS